MASAQNKLEINISNKSIFGFIYFIYKKQKGPIKSFFFLKNRFNQKGFDTQLLRLCAHIVRFKPFKQVCIQINVWRGT